MKRRGCKVKHAAVLLAVAMPLAACAATWSVGDVNGAPGLLLDGKPVEPCMFWQWTMEERDVKAFGAGGFRFFSQFVSGDHDSHPWWRDDGGIDLTFQATNLAKVLRWKPGAAFLPRLFYTPPAWWTAAHPEEQAGFATNSSAHASFASKLWRKEGLPLYAKAVKALDERFGDHLMGVHMATGPWGEHFGWDGDEECNLGYGKVHSASDTSESMRKAFASYLRKKYGGDETLLRRAFKDPKVTFETVHVPTLKERLEVNEDGWRNPAKSRLVPDYFECHNAVTVDLISRFAKAAKDATCGRKLVAAFYGYTQDESWGIEADHRAPSALYRCPYVDILSAPHTYNRREPGGDGSMRQYLASAALHGKLFIDEADDRTFLELAKKDRAEKVVPGYIAANVEDSVHVLFREFGNAITHGAGLWYMDIRKDNFRDPALVDACCRARKWALRANGFPRGRHSEVAVVSNPESEFYMAYRCTEANAIGTSLYHRQIPVFYRTGVPFDWYLIDDLDAVVESGAKVVVFLDCEYMTELQRMQVERLKGRGRTLVFFHAPGYVVEDGLSMKAMERVCGFSLKKVGRGPLAARDLSTGRVSGYADMQLGLFAPVVGDGVEPIASGTGCLSNETVIARKSFGCWTGVFAAVSALSADHVRRICRDAGVHVYTESDAAFSANESWAMLHTRAVGDYVVRFPGTVRRVTDIVSERVVGENVSSVTLQMGRFRTAVLLMEGMERPPSHVRIAGFEKDEPNVPKTFVRKDWFVAVTNLFGAGGGRSVRLAAPAHKPGFYSWPAVTVPVPEGLRDWRRFNKLQLDVAGLCDVAEKVFVRLPGSDNQGLTRTFRMPANGAARWTVDLLGCPKTVDLGNVKNVEIFLERPAADVELFVDDLFLAAPRAEERPEAVYDKASLGLLAARRGAAAAAYRAKRRAFRERLAADMREAGAKPGRILVGCASTMTQVRPEDTFAADGVRDLSVRLARGEREGVQLLVTAADGELSGVRVRASDLSRIGGGTLSASNISCDPVGYVKIDECGPYGVGDTVPTNGAPGYVRVVRKPASGWYEDPILSFMSETGVDVRKDSVQSFWVRVSAPRGQRAGTYRGELVVSARGERDVRIPFSVRVNDFEVPSVSPIPLAVSFNPEVFTDWPYLTFAEKHARRRAAADPEAPVNVWKRRRTEWGDFLSDYYITFTSLYNGNFSAVQWDILQKLKDEGKLGWFNLGYWHPVYKDTPDAWRTWRINTLERIQHNYAKAKKLGLAEHAYIYGCDEAGTNLFPAIGRALSELRKEFPSLPIATTTLDWTFGEDSPLKAIDIFTPTTEHYDADKAARARAAGRKVWWYIACGPRAPWANMWIESAPIEGRLLMGAMAQRMRPDGFLYYEISTWNSARPITDGPYTDWTARTWCGHNGDGAWTAVGPGGMPLATVRLENFRDGVEDLAYARELEKRLAKHRGDDAWSRAAREAIAVPSSVMDTMVNYTSSPAAVLEWRDRMADLIESSAMAGSAN